MCHNIRVTNKWTITMRKKGCFATSIAIQFLNYKRHLQLTTFIRHEC